MVALPKLMSIQDGFCPAERRKHPIRVTAVSKPVVSQFEMILLSAWTLPFSKLSAALSSLGTEKETVRDLVGQSLRKHNRFQMAVKPCIEVAMIQVLQKKQ